MKNSGCYNGRSNSSKFIGTVLDFQDDLDRLRLTRGDVSIGDILNERAPIEFAQALETLVRKSAGHGPPYLGYLEAPRLADALRIPGIDDPWMEMRSFCGRRIGEDSRLPTISSRSSLACLNHRDSDFEYRGELPLRIQALFLTMTVFWWDRGTNSLFERKEFYLAQTGYFLTG